jgi:two-component system, LuxR family, sensor kinase FixL
MHDYHERMASPFRLQQSDPVARSRLAMAALALLYLAAYLLLDRLSYLHPVPPLGITPWNPASGLSFVLLWRWGLLAVPLAVVAPMLAEVVVRGAPESLTALAVGSVWVATVYVGACEVLRRLGVDSHLRRARDVVWLAAVLVPATLLAALGYVSAFVLFEGLSAREWLSSVLRFWIGDLNGMLVSAPALLVWQFRAERWDAMRRAARTATAEIALQAASIVLALWIIFGLSITDEFKFFFLLFLPIIWIALRWGIPGAALSVVAIQGGLIVVVLLMGYKAVTFIEFQILMLALSATALIMGAVVTERRRVQEQLLLQQAALSRAEQFAAAGEMTAALAHEVNNPIAALLQYLQAGRILAERTPEERATLSDTLEKALHEGRRASDVVRTLRDLYRAGKLDLGPQDLAALAARVTEQFPAEAARRGVSLHLRPGGRVVTIGDPMQILILLRNLVENAISAAADAPRQRRVEIGVDEVDGRARVLIDDSGPGFAPTSEQLHFAQLRSSKPDGMGLGLAIANRIALAHAAQLAVERSTLGGARVIVEFPATESTRA